MGKVRNEVSILLLKFTNGQVLISKFMWLLSLLMFLKIFNFPKIYYYISFPIFIVLAIVVGHLYDKLGIRKIFEEENSKYILNKIKENK